MQGNTYSDNGGGNEGLALPLQDDSSLNLHYVEMLRGGIAGTDLASAISRAAGLCAVPVVVSALLLWAGGV